MTVNNSTNDVLFCFKFENSLLEYLSILDNNARSREENILRQNLFGEKIIQNCLKTDETHLYDNDLLLRQKTQKRLAVSSWCNG